MDNPHFGLWKLLVDARLEELAAERLAADAHQLRKRFEEQVEADDPSLYEKNPFLSYVAKPK